MTQASDRHGNVTMISHTTPITPKEDMVFQEYITMRAEIHRYIRQDTTEDSLLSVVVDACYMRSATKTYLGPNDNSMGFKLRLSSVQAAISDGLKAYTFGRSYLS